MFLYSRAKVWCRDFDTLHGKYKHHWWCDGWYLLYLVQSLGQILFLTCLIFQHSDLLRDVVLVYHNLQENCMYHMPFICQSDYLYSLCLLQTMAGHQRHFSEWWKSTCLVLWICFLFLWIYLLCYKGFHTSFCKHYSDYLHSTDHRMPDNVFPMPAVQYPSWQWQEERPPA